MSPQGTALVGRLHAVAEAHERRLALIIGADEYAFLFAPLMALAQGSRRQPGE